MPSARIIKKFLHDMEKGIIMKPVTPKARRFGVDHSRNHVPDVEPLLTALDLNNEELKT